MYYYYYYLPAFLLNYHHMIFIIGLKLDRRCQPLAHRL